MGKQSKINVFILIFLLCGGFWYFNKIFITVIDYMNTRQEFEWVSSRTNVDILLLGSSHMYASINPAVLDSLTNTVSFNKGTALMKFDFTSMALDHALKSTSPKLVVVELYRGSFSELNTKEKGLQLRLMDEQTIFSSQKLKKALSTYSIRELPSVYSPLIRNHQDWFTFDYLSLNRTRGTNPNRAFRYNGYVGALESLPEEQAKKYVNFKTLTPPLDTTKVFFEQRHLKELEQILEMSEKHDFELLIITAPDLPASRRNYQVHREIQRYCEKYGVNYLNFNDLYDTLKLDVHDFKDPYHLTLSGGIKVTEYLASYINKNYDLPDRSKDEFWVSQRDSVKYFKADYLYGSDLLPLKRRDSLFEEIVINNIATRKFEGRFEFTIIFDSIAHPKVNGKYKLAVQIFPKPSSKHQLSNVSKSKKRSFDTYAKVIDDINLPFDMVFRTRIDNIERIRFFLVSNGEYSGTIGNSVSIDGSAFELNNR